MSDKETLKSVAEMIIKRTQKHYNIQKARLPLISFDGAKDSRGKEVWDPDAPQSCIQLKETSSLEDIAHEIAHWEQQCVMYQTHCDQTAKAAGGPNYVNANTRQIIVDHRQRTKEILAR